jgi:predicted O-methyltransferase YrrM
MNLRENIETSFGRFRRLWKSPSKISSIGITDEAEAIQSLCYSDVNYPSKKQSIIFHSYIRMANIAYHLGCKNILEIGTGLSTAVWARFAQRTGAKVCNVDMDFGSMKSFFNDTNHETLVRENVELVEGATITPDEVIDFYTNSPRETFGGVEVSAFADNLDLFKNLNHTTQECQEVSALTPLRKWSVRDLVISGSSLVFPRKLLDIFSSGKSFDNEVALLKNLESSGEAGVLDNLIARGDRWDLVFFDCGELSSMIEWLKVKDRIIVGGLAAFHDIFFPKSFKNFIVCASVLADPDWKVVFIDETTKQGLMIAHKLNQQAVGR